MHRRRLASGVCLVGLVIALAGCGGGGGGSSTPTVVATPYSSASAVAFSGAATDSLDGSGTFVLAYTQSGSTLSGTWGAVYANTTEFLNGGTFSGTLAGTTLTGTATSEVGECNLSVSTTLSGSTSMSGSATGIGSSCQFDSASFTLTTFAIPTLAATYAGTATDSLAGSGTMSVAFTQYNVYLAGTYTDVFPTTPAYGNTSEPLAGVVTGASSAAFYLLQPNGGKPGCSLVLTGPASATTVSGTYGSQTCSGNETGTYNL